MQPEPGRVHDVSALSAAELERARRELAASLALARPGSPVRVPIKASLSAVDAELATQTAGIRFCSCGYGADNPIRFAAHLENNPAHRSGMSCHWPQCKITINGQDACDEGRDCK